MLEYGRSWRAAAVLIAALSPAVASAADLANGERVARRWCAECHVVAPGQKAASADVPSFQSLAADPERTPERLASLLAAPGTAHSRMQNLDLTRTEITDLVAYIKAQRP